MRLPQPSSGADGFSVFGLDNKRAVTFFWVLLVALTLLRLALAARLGVTPDEAYYWLWSQHLQSGYLDHPPMVALWIRLGTMLFGNGPLGIRFLGPVSALIGSLALYRAGRDLLGSPAAGYRAALLLNATLMLGLGAATATPDTPLVLFLALVLWSLGRLIRTGQPIWWLAIGVFVGLAFDSKYTAVLPGLGCGLWALATPSIRRHWGWILGGVLSGLLTIAPVLLWNAAHHWASFAKQGGRAGDWHPLRALNFLAELAGGQIGLATPIIFILFCLGLVWCLRRAGEDSVARLLACLCVVPVAVFVQHAFGGRVQANWPVVLYPAASLAAAATGRRIGVACALGLILTGLVTIQGIFSPLRLSAHHDVIARQTADWSGLTHRLREALPADVSLVAGDYALATIIAYHDPAHALFSYDKRWSYLGRALQHPERAMLVLRDTEQPDLPASWLGAQDQRRFCRMLRNAPMVCYKLIPLTLPANVQMYRLP
ncbi:ArnT family glycosyltransferase [Asaia spathodeae]|uniref:Glycosyltransferase family 39 protein n=1 Tax=Asaia spathodeae TaxID=657016 RepID=A0ABX2P635_9PROT|nr:glycosyltransferase family 39 protein [Asaia spathodeae]GBR11542.1 glycosyl/arabinosyl/mannosyl transferase [Asaia spathodeae NBRC 105894]